MPDANNLNVDEKSEKYVRSLQDNKQTVTEYYKKSLVKTEQQKFTEQLLKDQQAGFSTIADVACGGGTLSYHMKDLFPDAEFYLCDLNTDALELAKELCKGKQFHFSIDSIFELTTLPHHFFDAVFCWQTLLLFDKPQLLIDSLLRLPKDGGKLYFMSLFNLDSDVDIYAHMIDHTRKGGHERDVISYNTYSRVTVENWLKGKVKSFTIHPFHPQADIHYQGRGLGTNTIPTPDKRLQVSGGYLMNWGLLEITK